MVLFRRIGWVFGAAAPQIPQEIERRDEEAGGGAVIPEEAGAVEATIDNVFETLDRIHGLFDSVFCCLQTRKIIQIEKKSRVVLGIGALSAVIISIIAKDILLGTFSGGIFALSFPSIFLARRFGPAILRLEERRETVNQLQETIRRVQAVAAAAQGAAAAIAEDNRTLRISLEQLEQTEERLTAALEETRNNLRATRARLEEIQRENAEFRASNERLRQEIDRLHAAGDRVEEGSLTVEALAEALRRSQHEVETQEITITQLQQRLTRLQHLEAELEEQQRCINGLKTRIAQQDE